MTEQQALAKMIAPGTPRPSKWRGGVLQVQVTLMCDKGCLNCTTGSQLRGKPWFMTPEQYRTAILSLEGFTGVVGLFGGNCALSPHFEAYCNILRELVPFAQRGIWCNHPRGRAPLMRKIFNPAHSNLNCHLDMDAYREFKTGWPESHPFGHDTDSRHSPPWVALKDVVADEGERWEMISNCDLNIHWSASLTVVRGQLKGFFCEMAGNMASRHSDDPDWPDLGIDPVPGWWRRPMQDFADQVRWSCHRCGIPLRGRGALACDQNGVEQVSETHAAIYQPKKKDRRVELVTVREQLGTPLQLATDYLGNSKR